ncbi:hypothetical protein ACVH9Z_31170 [Rhodococcus opacus]
MIRTTRADAHHAEHLQLKAFVLFSVTTVDLITLLSNAFRVSPHGALDGGLTIVIVLFAAAMLALSDNGSWTTFGR